jgi:protocatechuate 3,4-dioxygenase beta subunit
MSKWKNPFMTLVVIVAMALPLFAQTDRATLEGTVTDPSGATISGARVKISAVETGITQERISNSNGQYRFPGIAIGEYRVSVARGIPAIL